MSTNRITLSINETKSATPSTFIDLDFSKTTLNSSALVADTMESKISSVDIKDASGMVVVNIHEEEKVEIRSDHNTQILELDKKITELKSMINKKMSSDIYPLILPLCVTGGGTIAGGYMWGTDGPHPLTIAATILCSVGLLSTYQKMCKPFTLNPDELIGFQNAANEEKIQPITEKSQLHDILKNFQNKKRELEMKPVATSSLGLLAPPNVTALDSIKSEAKSTLPTSTPTMTR